MNYIYGFLIGVFIKSNLYVLIIACYFLYFYPILSFLPGMLIGIMYPVRYHWVKYVNYYQVVEKNMDILTLKKGLHYLTVKKNKNFYCETGNVLTGKVVSYKSIKRLTNAKVIYTKDLDTMDKLRHSIKKKYTFLSEILGLTNNIFPTMSCTTLKMLFLIKYTYIGVLHLFALWPYLYFIVNNHVVSTVVTSVLCYFLCYLHCFSWVSLRILGFFLIRSIIFIPYNRLLYGTFILSILTNQYIIFNQSFLLSMLGMLILYNHYSNLSLLLGLLTGNFNLLRMILGYNRSWILLINIICNCIHHITKSNSIKIYVEYLPSVKVTHPTFILMLLLCVLHYDLFHKTNFSYLLSCVFVVKSFLLDYI